MKRLLYRLCQWSWGLPQTLVGALFYLYYCKKGCRHFSYQGAFAVIWTKKTGSMSLGCFLFLYPDWTPGNRALLEHEYGHTIQSLYFGPFYLLTVGLPSLLWAGLPALQRRRRSRNISYYAVYPEKQASALGQRFAKQALPGEQQNGDGAGQAP
ncbi:MAG: hypothetical protein IIY70_04550 [Oscillospiraceae bacterium]|nr:hypothetical protein [Oscillospiraceae bacterium]